MRVGTGVLPPLVILSSERVARILLTAFVEPGVGMLAARLRVPVVPVRVSGLEKVLHKSARWATPGRARVAFGAPIRFDGDDYKGIASQIEDAVRAL